VEQGASCCYLVTEQGGGCPSTGTGRPFLVGAAIRTASVAREDRGWTIEALLPDTEDLSPAAREALGRAWEADALLEHASIAAFSRFSLELLAARAPGDLIAAAHQAAIEEVGHARTCFTLAQRYRGGAAVGPSPFPF